MLSGQIWDGEEAIIEEEMPAGLCHNNSIKVWVEQENIKICTGYALSDDRWIRHTWIIDGEGNIGTHHVPAGENNKISPANIDFMDILMPSLFALIFSVIFSLIGLSLRLSWFSFILAIILSVGFFAGTIKNEFSALISGLVVGLVLGSLEFTLVNAVFGSFGAALYKGFFGSSQIILMILGAVVGYISKMFLKDSIRGILDNLGISRL